MSQFLLEFGTLFAIINPYGLSFVFLSRTMNLSDRDRGVVARQIAVYAFGVLAVSLFAGTTILGFFGVSMPALRIAGGLVVAVSGWSMLNERHEGDDRRPTSTGGIDAIRQEAFFPLTIPLTTGPGTIATIITLSANHDPTQGRLWPQLVSLAVLTLVSATIFHAYARVSRMARLVGVEGTRVITRLSAFLLLCVGVQIVMTGVTDALRPILADE